MVDLSTVFVVQHVAREDQPDEDVKFIGVYSSHDRAESATQRLMKQAGFRDYPNSFHIGEYALDKDHWTEGFVVV
jgi:hypothetical protein